MSGPAVTEFDHVGWFTCDIEGSVRFWTEIMGFTETPAVERRGAWIGRLMGFPGAHVKIVHLFGHNTHVEFIQFEPTLRHGNPATGNAVQGHICLKVSNIVDLRDRMLAHGAIKQGVLTAIQEGAARGLRGMYIRDPNGILIELIG